MTNNSKVDDAKIATRLHEVIEDSVLNFRGVFKSQEYEITLLNESGDARTKSTQRIINTSTEEITDHRSVVVSDSEMQSEEMGFRASCGAQKLDWEITQDSPKEKHFAIYFPNPLEFMENMTLKFQYLWKRMFPEKNEYYLIYTARPSRKLRFILRYSGDLEILEFKISKYSRFYGVHEEFPLTPKIFSWNKEMREIKIQFVPDIFCQYKYQWTRK